MKRATHNKNPIKCVIFDVSGVLALGESSQWKDGKFVPSGVHEYIAKKLKVSLDQYLDSIDTTYALAIEGKIPDEEIIETISKNLKTTPKKLKKLYLISYRRHFKQNKQLFKQAFKLKKLGYNIAVLSDQWFLSKEAIMPSKYYKKFDEVVISYKVGIRKPNPEIYKLIIKKLNIKPKEALFIDNQEWNLKPAKKIGFNVILFKGNKQLFYENKWKGLFVTSGLK